MSPPYTNALAKESSPYLLQHAHQPVQWYPWGETALTTARQHNKPILLSIGYSACHWCHVMAHESFDDPDIAAVMNELFINIKVDREERPDLDKIYQLALQALTQRPGGWPLTLFLNPTDCYPFFGGTYFPPQPRHGLPAFVDLLKRVADFYHHHYDQIETQNTSLADFFRRYQTTTIADQPELTDAPLNAARLEIAQSFDKIAGGFEGAPKFPHLPLIQFLLHHVALTAQQGLSDEVGLHMAMLTLEKIALGGIYDHLGGGFYRYATDNAWTIPHFEKMLYDNGLFLNTYSEAWQLTQLPLFKQVIMKTIDWAVEVMRSPTGGFYAALDADSAGKEGDYYLWQREDVKKILDEPAYTLLAHHFGLHETPNFEAHWHFCVHQPLETVAEQQQLPLAEAEQQLTQACEQLLKVRTQRPLPARDEKILTAWNALMIKGLAKAGIVLKKPGYLDKAVATLDFIKTQLWIDNRLLAVYKDNKAYLNAYLDDHAFLLDAVLTLLQARWRDSDLTFAIALAETLLADFADPQQGGFYFTAHHHEALITRPKSFTDEAIPAGNGVAAFALGRLGHLLGEIRYLKAAEQTLQAAWGHMSDFASAHPTLLLTLQDYLFPPQLIILRGKPEPLQIWQQACQAQYAPQRLCFAIPTETQDLPDILANYPSQGDIVAYLCTGQHCQAPITTLTTLVGELQRTEAN